MKTEFSVCMSVYKNDNPTYFSVAVRSILTQTVVPSEIILVEDGPVSDELENAVKDLQKSIDILKVIRLPENVGHASN